MIDTHHLAYAGVLLVFLTGAAIVALATFLFMATGVLAAAAVRIIKLHASARLTARAYKRKNAVEVPLSMEEALRRVAYGKAESSQELPGKAQGIRALLRPY